MNLSTLNEMDPETDASSHHDEDDTSGLEALEQPETEFLVNAQKKPVNQTALMLFAILVIGGAGIWAMNTRTGPKSAKAADPTAIVAQATIHDFMQRGSSNIALLRTLLDGTARIVEQFKVPTVVQVPLSDLKANPFHFATAKVAVADDGSDAARKRKDEEKLAIQTAVRGLQLQSLVLRANRKACMINNTLYEEGESVDAFKITAITNEGVVVQQAGYRFRLQMGK